MLKSPEEYLSSLSFEAPEPHDSALDAGEKAFVEKYLGLDALREISPEEPLPMLLQEPAPARPVKIKEPEIIVAQKAKPIEEAPLPIIAVAPLQMADKPAEKAASKSALQIAATVKPADAPVQTKAPVSIKERVAEAVCERIQSDSSLSSVVRTAEAVDQEKATVTEEQPVVEQATVELPEAAQSVATAAQAGETNLDAASQLTQEQALREKLRTAEQIQTVSFLVAGQLFLLPVMGIQEVVRQIELVKVPQAPSFIAGAINLRGRVLPLVFLSELLTNAGTRDYSEKSFVIITGEEALQIGLIVDRVNSMHMIPQQKFIWNAESKIGDAAEFLSAIVDLDDKVCGLVSIEAIKQKILSAF